MNVLIVSKCYDQRVALTRHEPRLRQGLDAQALVDDAQVTPVKPATKLLYYMGRLGRVDSGSDSRPVGCESRFLSKYFTTNCPCLLR